MDSHAQDQRDALAEALTCTTCTLSDLTRATYHKHVQTGVYNPSHDPPFTITNNPESFTSGPSPSPFDDVSPDTITPSPTGTPPTPTTPSYHSLMTPSQLTRYQALITAYASQDAVRDMHFARFRIDYHIHLHYLCRRGMLALCRNADDLHEFRQWRWGVFLAEESPGAPRRPRRWGWPGDAGLFMLYQVPMWRRGWAARRECVEQARVKWALIVEEYRRRRWREAWRELWGGA